MKVIWTKDGKEIRSGGNFRITFLENTPHLIIQKADRSDSGSYSCRVSNEVGSDICENVVIVKDRKIPPSFTRKMRDSQATEGSSSKFECRITGSPPFDVKWYHNGSDLIPKDTCRFYMSENVAVLEFLEFQLTDAGTYMCKATNEVGSTTTTAKLFVKGKVLIFYSH
uniref:Ig-like domain-containing protein n=1 Tax=Eptatretus burgeri TaxID=7764 RepID=A0A8C4R3F6_EPTBU